MTPPAPTGDARVEPPQLARRLAAIAVIDVTGYSRLMEADESGTHQRWTEMRSQVIVPMVRAHRGDIIKSTGDGFLIEFRSAVDAVSWALHLERTLADASAAALLPLRIALHLADIIPEADDIFGDGVNIASRLQEHAEPGSIVVSGAVHEQVRGVLDYTARPIGPLTLKNIRRPIDAFRISGSDIDARRPSIHRAAQREVSIAILPFRTFGAEAVDAYFAEGVAHDIVASLTSLRELFVISSTTTAAIARQEADAAEVGRRLGVRYLVTGVIARSGDRLRFHVALDDIERGATIWNARYDIGSGELFATQDLIASKIAYALVPHLRQSELQRALRKRPDEMGAYDFVLQALYKMYRLEEVDFERAHELLRQAVERDPRYAMAYSLMAQWYMFRIGQGGSTDVDADSREALRCVSVALENDPGDPLALGIYGHTLSYLFRDYHKAAEAFDRALASSPNSALAWGYSSPTFSYLGDGVTAIQRAEHALRLSPLDPYAYWFQTALSLAHYVNGTWHDAVYWGRKTMATNGRFTANMRVLIASLVATGDLPEARRVADAMLRLEPNFAVEPYIADYPFVDPAARTQFGERLVAAGLPLRR